MLVEDTFRLGGGYRSLPGFETQTLKPKDSLPSYRAQYAYRSDRLKKKVNKPHFIIFANFQLKQPTEISGLEMGEQNLT